MARSGLRNEGGEAFQGDQAVGLGEEVFDFLVVDLADVEGRGRASPLGRVGRAEEATGLGIYEHFLDAGCGLAQTASRPSPWWSSR